MVKCPKCGYTRTPKDDEFVSAQECPRCGIVYEKFIENVSKTHNGTDLSSKDNVDKRSAPTNNSGTSNFKRWSQMIMIPAVAVVVFTSMMFAGKSNQTHQYAEIDKQQTKEQRQQQIVVCLNRIDCVPSTLNSACSNKCRELFGYNNIDQFIGGGWNIVSSTEQISTINLDKPDDSWRECSCVSTKYLIEK